MTKTIRQIVTGRAFVTVSPQETVRTGCAILNTHQLTSIAVLEGQRLLGLFDATGVAQRTVALWRDVDVTCVGDVMDSAPVTIPVHAPLQSALELILMHRLSGLVVMENECVLGILTLADMPFLGTVAPRRVRGLHRPERIALQ